MKGDDCATAIKADIFYCVSYDKNLFLTSRLNRKGNIFFQKKIQLPVDAKTETIKYEEKMENVVPS